MGKTTPMCQRNCDHIGGYMAVLSGTILILGLLGFRPVWSMDLFRHISALSNVVEGLQWIDPPIQGLLVNI
jgi:hypothetical protein